MIKEGRYDLMKGFARVWMERGHKSSLDAHLGKLEEQYIKDMAQVKIILDYAIEAIKEVGGCDHSVGICMCDLLQAVDHVQRIFPLSKGRN